MPIENLDQYHRGSIARIELWDFVKYKHIVQLPGPHLNIIYGPNGIGKSTFVSAIALGLGGNPGLLGRAKEISEYVRNGCSEASIQIELAVRLEDCPWKRPRQRTRIVDGKRVPIECDMKSTIIQRTMFRRGNASKWQIDGAEASLARVHALVASLGIQLGNLCHFLPQDRVSEFAELSAVKLLRETEASLCGQFTTEQELGLSMPQKQDKSDEGSRGAITSRGDGLCHNNDAVHSVANTEVVDVHKGPLTPLTLVDVHEILVNEKKREQSAENEMNIAQERHDRVESRYLELQEKVEALRRRERIELRKRALECRLPWFQYSAAREKVRAQKESVNKHKENVSHLEHGYNPCNDRLRLSQSLLEGCERHRDEVQEKVQNLRVWDSGEYQTSLRLIRSHAEDISQKSDDSLEIMAQLNECSKTLDRAKRVTENFRESSEYTEARKKNEDAVRQEHCVRRKLRDIQEQRENIEKTRRVGEQEHDQALIKLQRALARRSDLQDSWRRRFRILKQEGGAPDVCEACEWLERNKSDLKSPVFGPILKFIHVKDPRDAAIIHNACGQNILTFVCQNDKDYEFLTTELVERKRLRISMVKFEENKLHGRVLPPDVIENMGFDGLLMDAVECPEPVLFALCENNNFHRIPFARSPEAPLSHNLIHRTRSIARYFVGQQGTAIVYSKYGKQLPSLRNWEVGSGRLLDDREAHAEILDLSRSIQELEKQTEKSGKFLRDSNEECALLRSKESALTSESEHLQTKRSQFEHTLRKLDQMEAEEERCHMKLLQLRRRSEVYQDQAKRKYDDIRTLRLSLLSRVRSQLRLGEEAFKHMLGFLVALKESEKASLKLKRARAEKERREVEYQAAKQGLKESRERYAELKGAALELKGVADSVLQGQPGGVIDLLQSDEFKAMSRLDAELALSEAQHSLTITEEGDREAEAEYTLRGTELDQCKRVLEDHRHRVQKIRDAIQRARLLWEPKVEELVSSVSEEFHRLFEQVGCEGEVKLEKTDDFGRWGVAILVNFRDGERLQELTSQRQSGGERAVSTILYLLALHAMTNCPFRVVDEINQGMDDRNERLVHNLMTSLACIDGRPQYFMVTPKLLTQLDYLPKTRIIALFDMNASGGYLQREEDEQMGEGQSAGHHSLV